MERKINQITVCPDKEGLKSCWFLNQEASDFAADRRARRGRTKQLSSRGRDKGVSKKCLEKKKKSGACPNLSISFAFIISEREAG